MGVLLVACMSCDDSLVMTSRRCNPSLSFENQSQKVNQSLAFKGGDDIKDVPDAASSAVIGQRRGYGDEFSTRDWWQ